MIITDLNETLKQGYKVCMLNWPHGQYIYMDKKTNNLYNENRQRVFFPYQARFINAKGWQLYNSDALDGFYYCFRDWYLFNNNVLHMWNKKTKRWEKQDVEPHMNYLEKDNLKVEGLHDLLNFVVKDDILVRLTDV